MTIHPLDATQIGVLVTASVAITQIVKDAWLALGGKTGEWLKVVCVAVATGLGAVMIFDPALWTALVVPLVGAIGTGGVSFVKELQSPGTSPAGE